MKYVIFNAHEGVYFVEPNNLSCKSEKATTYPTESAARLVSSSLRKLFGYTINPFEVKTVGASNEVNVLGIL